MALWNLDQKVDQRRDSNIQQFGGKVWVSVQSEIQEDTVKEGNRVQLNHNVKYLNPAVWSSSALR